MHLHLLKKSERLWISIQSTQFNYHNLIIQLIEGEKNIEICYGLRKFTVGINGLEFTLDAQIKYLA